MLSSTQILGVRLLREVEASEESLEDLLSTLRKTSIPNPPRTGIVPLDALWRAHNPNPSAPLAITGKEGMQLLYHIVSHMLTGLSGTVVVLDMTARFSPSQLRCDREAYRHLHVFFPTRGNLRVTMEGLENYMLYGDHESKGKEWVGTVLVGGEGGMGIAIEGVDVNVMVGYRGWLCAEREEVAGFGEGVSVQEAWGEREMRMDVVESKGWIARCEEGEYRWR